MVVMRDPSLNGDPPPDYAKNSGLITLSIHYGGSVTNTGGEEFDDSDSEYEYKMNEDQDEIEDVAAENDDWDFKVEEELVDNVIKDADEGKKSEARDGRSRDYVPEHTCNISFNVRNMKSSWLSKKYFHKFKSDPKRTVKGFRIDAIEDVRCNISTNQAARAKKLAMLMLHGNPAQQFALLWDYADEVKRSNPGSTVILGTEQNMFDRFYVCLHALRMNFLAGCRPVLCVDGCHLKGPHGGVLLAAVGIDPNNNFFPLCYAVVFVRHLHSNFKSNGFRGLAFKNGLWKAARATTVNQFNERMKELNELDEGAYAWFNDKPPKEWSRSHFSPHPRCDILLNNACECFNSNILEAREKPILTMLEWLMEYLMKRVQQNRDRALKRKWDLSGIPCKHVVSAILCQGEDIEKYTHQCYRVETYLKAYHHPILPINGRDEWKKSDFNPPVPPKAVKRVGRPPKSSRRLEVDEPVNKKKKRRGAPILKEGSSRIKRQQTTVKCGKCGHQGHNARGCATKTAPSEPVPDASSQVPPKEQPQKIQVRRKGKAIMHEPEVVLHKRTRSGNIPAAAPVIRKLQNIKPTKSFATAPSMFQQFQQCHKGVKIKEPANFVDAEVGGRSLDEQGVQDQHHPLSKEEENLLLCQILAML
ncbi:UNVERIFIED_CONTAM: hypothetical protein Sradi_3325500 [Sesamum radiatum]|uniref:CCHC-type domain-containing protein n=1 Tax=Sesamum radiatum TaxID=300843 RepID=A0AAW2R1Y4_SESRA